MQNPSSISTSSRWSVPKDVVVQNTADGSILLDLDKGVYYGVNEVGMDMLDLIKAGKSFGAIVKLVAEDYGQNELSVKQDLIEIIESMLSDGLLKPASDSS